MNKAVFVTGGTVGSGLACAERFAKEGYDVFITSRNGERAQAAADGVAEKYGVFAKGYALDIRDEQRVIDVFNDIDGLDRFVETVVLNSADMGFGTDPAKGMDFFTVPVEEFQRVFETNLVWNFMIVRQAALRMREHHKGAVVFIGSNTSYRAIPNRAAYGASKGGINAMSKAFAIDLGPYGIRSNVVLPGTIKTARWVEMGSKQIVNGTLTPKLYMYLKERCSETEDGSCNPYPWQMLVALGRDDLHKSYLGYTYCDDLEALGYIKMQGYGKNKKIFIIKEIDF